MVLHTQAHTQTPMATAQALERNGHTNSGHAYNHPETVLPKDGHTQTQPDSQRLRVTAIRISETVMYAKSHSMSVHVTQPYITVMVPISQLPAIPHPAVPCQTITEKHTVSLPANMEVTPTSMGPHTITAPCGETHNISHTEASAHNFHYTHTSSQVCA